MKKYVSNELKDFAGRVAGGFPAYRDPAASLDFDTGGKSPPYSIRTLSSNETQPNRKGATHLKATR